MKSSKRFSLLSLSLMVAISCPAWAKNSHEEVQSFLKHVFTDNSAYIKALSHEHLSSYAEQQSPRATVVACSDSRVQTNVFHKDAVNDLFFIRNIGNQIKSTEGSVEYGVSHLKTPVLLIVGHSNCGAIHAAMSDYSKESKAIQQELDFLHLPKSDNTNEGVVENVHQQVSYALEKFKDKVAKDELVVVGAVYDFRDDYNQGHGRLILIDLNGERNPQKIKESDYVKGTGAVVLDLK